MVVGRRRGRAAHPAGGFPAAADYLIGQSVDSVTLTLAQVEAVLGQALPRIAYTRSWWTNPGLQTSHRRAWVGAGWQVAAVDARSAVPTVTFTRRAEYDR